MNKKRLYTKVILNPYIMHQMKAGRQDNVSGIAIPSQGIKRIIEQIAIIAKRVASMPIVRSDWSRFIVSPIIRSDIASNTKKAAETIKCSV